MLAFCAERMNAVEINNTFYRMPRASVLEQWVVSVPDDFTFVIKASRRIKHFKRLNEPEEPLATSREPGGDGGQAGRGVLSIAAEHAV